MSIFTPRSVVATSALTAALLALAPAAATADEHDIPGTAGAATLTGTPEPPRPAFYEPPAEIPTTPGTIIRQEKADNVLDPLDVTSASFDARRVMYASQDREGRPIAVTGFVVSPRATWLGKGPRPTISFSVGTQGMGDSCAPSRQLRDFTEYEILAFKGLLLRGYAVALTDYQGLGTPGSHTYMVRAAQGQAVLDMARAAQRVGVRGLSAANPIGLMGYSKAVAGRRRQPSWRRPTPPNWTSRAPRSAPCPPICPPRCRANSTGRSTPRSSSTRSSASSRATTWTRRPS